MHFICTGHRPDWNSPTEWFTHAEAAADAAVAHILAQPADTRVVVTGCALGWDQVIAKAALDADIETLFCIPVKGFAQHWTQPSRDHLAALMRHPCARIEVVCPISTPVIHALHMRNLHMLDYAKRSPAEVIAYFNGKPGGTANCLAHARRRNLTIHNFFNH